MKSIARPPRGGQTTVDFGPLFNPAAYIADVPLRVDIDGAIEFLYAVTAACGFGNVGAISPDGRVVKWFGFDRASVGKARKFLEDHAESNLYWTVNPTRRLVHGKPSKPDIAAVWVVHLDLDDPSPEALARLRQASLPPTFIIFTGGGYGAYWKLKEPIPVNGNVAELETINQHVIDVFGAGKGTQDISRLMRLPYTVNRLSPAKIKRGRKPAATYIVDWHPERQYTLEQLAGLTAPGEPRPRESVAHSVARVTVKKLSTRSEELLRLVGDGLRAGLTVELIHRKYDDHPHARDQGDSYRAVQRCIDKVREDALAAAVASGAPEPLRRKPESAEPFPLEALGELLFPLAKRMRDVIKAPDALIGQSLLAGASLAAQPHADVEIDGRRELLSLYHMSIGESGERKSAVDSVVLIPHREYEQERCAQYDRELAQYGITLDAFKAQRRYEVERAKKTKAADAVREAVLKHGAPLNLH